MKKRAVSNDAIKSQAIVPLKLDLEMILFLRDRSMEPFVFNEILQRIYKIKLENRIKNMLIKRC